LLQFCLS